MNSTSSNTKSRRRVAWSFFAILLTVTTLIGGGIYWMTRPTLANAQLAFDNGDFETANGIVDRLLRYDDSNEAIILGAKLARGRQDSAEAERLLGKMVDQGSESVEQFVESGKMWGRLGRLEKAEESLRTALKHNSRHLDANKVLLDLYRMEGRNWEAHELAANIFPQKHFQLKHLQIVGNLEAAWRDINQDYLVFCEERDHKSPLPQLGRVRLILAREMDNALARQRLFEFVATDPELVEPQAILGEFLLENGEEEEFLQWHAKLPKGVDRHPTIWVLRGLWAQEHDPQGAMRCFWEAIKRFPNDRIPHLALARLLNGVGRNEDAAPFQKRGDLLLTFDNELLRGDGTPESVRKMIETLELLERRWEAIGWCQILLDKEPSAQSVRQTIARLTSKLNTDSPLTPDTANPALAIDLSNYPIPRFPSTKIRTDSGGSGDETAIAFRDSSGEVGLDFRYLVDHERMRSKVYTFDFAGGGVGVIDFDGSGWPDVYLTQARHWPVVSTEDEPRNSLFLNRGGEFVDVAELAKVADQEFGLGTAVGDYNADGFSDLYVTNLGTNVLYLNNGDGTFENTSVPSGTTGDRFSLSAAFGDFSGDGLPDLYVVNYLGGDALERQCELEGRLTQCSPILFPGQDDVLYLNLGDGTFRDVASEAGIKINEGPGKGMGILVANIDGQAGLDIFVTNDTMANRLYINQNPASGQKVRFVEQGRIAGVAYDGRGRLQGSMGIAAGHVQHNRMLDVFVTNYTRERNNYFSQSAQYPQSLFDDVSRLVNLAQISTGVAGWGAQFVDAELDGDSDLFVANGHLDEYTHAPEAKQRPHLFENLGQRRYQLLPTASKYLEREFFGRAVATLDWNRDGLQDLCVTHRDAPVALLTNVSQRQGNFVSVQLRGVESSRDAIGTVVELETGGKHWIAALTGGGGFSAMNQHELVIGLGQQTKPVEKMTIHWPTGEPQVFESTAFDRRWLILQGDATLHPLPD